MLGQQLGFVVAGIDDHHPALVELEMAFDQGQGAAADRTKADHDDRAGDLAVNRIGGVCHFGLTPEETFPETVLKVSENEARAV
ncbi:hypothetical protein D3C72_2214790 [compost metagenome]